MHDNYSSSRETTQGSEFSSELQDIQDLLISVLSQEITARKVVLHAFRSFRPQSANNFVFTALTEEGELVFLKAAPFNEGISHAVELYTNVGPAEFSRRLRDWVKAIPYKESPEGGSYRIMEQLAIPSPKVLLASGWYLVRGYLPGTTLAEYLEIEDDKAGKSPAISELLKTIATYVCRFSNDSNLVGTFPSYSVRLISNSAVLVIDPYAPEPLPLDMHPADVCIFSQIHAMKSRLSHGDLKPTNILVNSSSEPMLIDPMIRWAPPQNDVGRFLVRLALQMFRQKERFVELSTIFWESFCDEYDWRDDAVSPNELLIGALFLGLANVHALLSKPSSRYGILIGKDYGRLVYNREYIMSHFYSKARLPRSFPELFDYLHGHS